MFGAYTMLGQGQPANAPAPAATTPNNPATGPVTNDPTTGQPGTTAPVTGDGATTAKPKRKAPERIKYRGTDQPKLSAVPTDFASKHLPLSKDDFTTEKLYYEFKAVQAQKSADKFRQMAADCVAFGDADDRKAAQAFAKHVKGMNELQAKLTAKFGAEKVREMMAAASQDAPVAPVATATTPA